MLVHADQRTREADTCKLLHAGKMEGKLDYDRTLDQQGENTLSAEGRGHTGGGDLLSRVLGQGALDNNVQQASTAPLPAANASRCWPAATSCKRCLDAALTNHARMQGLPS